MIEAALNRFRIFKISLPLKDKLRLFVFSVKAPIYKRINKTIHPITINIPLYNRRVSLFDSTDLSTFMEVFFLKEYEIFAKPQVHRILDLGANSGFASAYLANLFPNSQVIAVEPDIASIYKIKINIKDYDGRIILEPSAVASSTGNIAFYLNFNTTISGSIIAREEKSPKVIVPSISLADIELKYGGFDLVKFDIEGSEWEAVYPAMLTNKPKIWIGEYHTDLTKQPVENFLERFEGYDISLKKLGTKRFIIIAELT